MEWKRNCPKCNDELVYKSANAFYRARSQDTLCKPCSKIGKKNPFYGKSFSKQQIRKWSKERSGAGNINFGGTSGMFGHQHSEKTKQKQSLAHRKRWVRVKGVPLNKLHVGWSKWKKYRREVDRLTRKLPLHLLENFDKRNTAGIDGAYHLDHIISVYKGFKQSIPPEKIASMENVRMIPWMENQHKWWK